MSDLYTPLTQGELAGLMLRAISANRPEFRTQPGSLLRLDYEAVARAIADNHAHLDAIARNVTPLDADEVGLALWALVTGVTRKAGTPARKAQSARARGVAATAIPAGSVLNHATGIQYQTTAAAAIGGDGDVLLDIEALTAGSVTRLEAGEELIFNVAIPSVETSVLLVLDLDEGGTDQQSLGSWREDILRVWREGRQGGARSDYEIWCAEVAWTDRCFVYPRKPSIVSVGITALKSGTGTAQIPTTPQRDELLAYLEARRPVTDDVTWITVDLTPLHVEIVVVLAPGVSPDWSAPGSPGITLDSYDPNTQTVTTNESLPSDFQAGDLLTLVSDTQPAGADGRPSRVAAVTGATTFVVAPYTGFSQPFGFTPVGGEAIWPCSELLAGIRAEVLDGFLACDDIEIAGLRDLGPANPGRKYGPWESDARETSVVAVASYRTDVVSATAAIQGATSGVLAAVEYPYPNNRIVQKLEAGQVFVHA